MFPPFLPEKYPRGHPVVTAGLLNFMALQSPLEEGWQGGSAGLQRKMQFMLGTSPCFGISRSSYCPHSWLGLSAFVFSLE